MGPGRRWGWRRRKGRTGLRWEAWSTGCEGLDLFLVNSGEERKFGAAEGQVVTLLLGLGKGGDRACGLRSPATPVSASMCPASLGEAPGFRTKRRLTCISRGSGEN